MNKEELLRCISDCDKNHHAMIGAACIAHDIKIEISLDHAKEIAHRRNNPDYVGLSDQEVVATSLNPEQMANFIDFFRKVPNLPPELIKPFESSESAEITEIIKPPEIVESLAS